MNRDQGEVCRRDPGFEVDLRVTADTLALHRIWIGRLTFADAFSEDLIEIDGPSDLVRAFPGWLALSVFAGVMPAAPTRLGAPSTGR